MKRCCVCFKALTHTPRWCLLPFCRQSGSSRGKADRPWEPRELKLGKVTSEGMVTMTARQPEGVAAELQQQAKSNLILNCNYVQAFECESVWFLKWVFTFPSRYINTTQWRCIHELCLFYFFRLSVDVQHIWASWNPANASVRMHPARFSPICCLHGQPSSQSVEAPETSPLRLPPYPFRAGDHMKCVCVLCAILQTYRQHICVFVWG